MVYMYGLCKFLHKQLVPQQARHVPLDCEKQTKIGIGGCGLIQIDGISKIMFCMTIVWRLVIRVEILSTVNILLACPIIIHYS